MCVCVFTRFSRISKYLLRNPGTAEGFPEGCIKCMCAIALPGRKDNENMGNRICYFRGKCKR